MSLNLSEVCRMAIWQPYSYGNTAWILVVFLHSFRVSASLVRAPNAVSVDHESPDPREDVDQVRRKEPCDKSGEGRILSSFLLSFLLLLSLPLYSSPSLSSSFLPLSFPFLSFRFVFLFFPSSFSYFLVLSFLFFIPSFSSSLPLSFLFIPSSLFSFSFLLLIFLFLPPSFFSSFLPLSFLSFLPLLFLFFPSFLPLSFLPIPFPLLISLLSSSFLPISFPLLFSPLSFLLLFSLSLFSSFFPLWSLQQLCCSFIFFIHMYVCSLGLMGMSLSPAYISC